MMDKIVNYCATTLLLPYPIGRRWFYKLIYFIEKEALSNRPWKDYNEKLCGTMLTGWACKLRGSYLLLRNIAFSQYKVHFPGYTQQPTNNSIPSSFPQTCTLIENAPISAVTNTSREKKIVEWHPLEEGGNDHHAHHGILRLTFAHWTPIGVRTGESMTVKLEWYGGHIEKFFFCNSMFFFSPTDTRHFQTWHLILHSWLRGNSYQFVSRFLFRSMLALAPFTAWQVLRF